MSRAMRGVRAGWRDWLATPDPSVLGLTAFAVSVMTLSLVLTFSRSGILCFGVTLLVAASFIVRRRGRGHVRRLVAGQHDAVLDAQLMQPLDHRTALLADLVRVRHEARELAVHGDVEARIAALVERRAIMHRRRSVVWLSMAAVTHASSHHSPVGVSAPTKPSSSAARATCVR